MALADGHLGPNGSVAVAQVYQGRLSVDPQGGALTITPVALQDTGIYTVEVFPLGGQVWRGDVQVEVYELVGKVSVTPPSLEVTEGARLAVLTCTPMRGTITWTKDGQSLDQDPRFRVSAGTLQISWPERNDTGSYDCTVSNPFSNGIGIAQIRVYYGPDPPTIHISSDRDPEPQRYVRVNSTVGLSCRAPSDPPAQIYWSLADASDPLVPAQPDLTLPRVQLSQAGPYSCLASNPHTQHRLRTTVTLTVTQIPPGSPSCSLDSVANGTALRFRCSWPGGSPAPSLSLQGLPGGGEQGVGPALERTLSSLLPALSGTRVTCLGRHLAAEGTCSMTPEAPSGVSLSFQASLDPGGTVLLDLQCQGTYRPVEITWARHGEPLGPGGRYRVSAGGARLTISNFTAPQDLGGYSVRCQNPLGSQESNLTLTGPSISGWSLARGSEPGSARLSWVVPEGSVVTGFWIQVQGPPGGPGGWGVADAADTRGRHSLQHRGGAPTPNPLFLPAAASAGRPGWGAQPHADAPISLYPGPRRHCRHRVGVDPGHDPAPCPPRAPDLVPPGAMGKAGEDAPDPTRDPPALPSPSVPERGESLTLSSPQHPPPGHLCAAPGGMATCPSSATRTICASTAPPPPGPGVRETAGAPGSHLWPVGRAPGQHAAPRGCDRPRREIRRGSQASRRAL
ncbi:LOW QUALITY PROTEIN: V-set and immunoglobulin domain-containing protein 10-like [Eretmochelys imbricata]